MILSILDWDGEVCLYQHRLVKLEAPMAAVIIILDLLICNFP